MDEAMNAVNEELLKVEETDHSCSPEFLENSLTGHVDGSCTTECVTVDWSAEVKQENLSFVKQEPDDVCWVLFSAYHNVRIIDNILMITS